MKALIIGYGSIGKRHYQSLSAVPHIDRIDIVTKQDIAYAKTFRDIESVEDISSYDYFLIASETVKHFDQLKYLDSAVTGKKIFCEKPLFDRQADLSIHNNTVYVGYVLRFNSVIQMLKQKLEGEKPLTVSAICGQYLPTWRPDTDYRQCYSAHKDMGGGVLLDISHEIDYVQWLFGRMDATSSVSAKISDLEIDSDDYANIIGRTESGCMVSISLDYISKISVRDIRVSTVDKTFHADLIAGTLTWTDKNGNTENYKQGKTERNTMFIAMHESILNGEQTACTYEEGMDVMNVINRVQEQNR